MKINEEYLEISKNEYTPKKFIIDIRDKFFEGDAELRVLVVSFFWTIRICLWFIVWDLLLR